jgi:hypothetical protein
MSDTLSQSSDHDDESASREIVAMAVHPALAADLMLINGRLLTMTSHNTVVQVVAVKDGKVVTIGDTAEVEVLAGATTQSCTGSGFLKEQPYAHLCV